MRIPISWLSEYCDPGLSAEELTERLSMTGTEVERIADAGAPSSDGFVVGHVEAVDDHPDADRLRVCSVVVGEAESRTIVCGAPNVAAGQTVAVALPGAVMPDGTKLGEAKLRGVKSSGMILSERELELGDDHGGIAVLETDTGPGTPLQDVVPVSDTVLEVEVTPNRPDCFGIYGVAREVHAITGAELAPAPWEADAEATGEGKASDYATVDVEVPDLCPRFTARVFTDVEIGPSPLWLKQRLAAAGQRPINNVVDITNYVMLLTAQPLHAFDLDEIRGGGLVVRRAVEGETMTTLDDVERSFDSEAVLVCDKEGPSGIAGIMGGQISEVSEGTTRVLLEVATWDGPNILTTSGKLGLRSEASTRFEKQLHPDLAMRAQRIASRLMVELCGARLVPGTIDVDAGAYPPRGVELRTERVSSLLGMDIPAEQARTYLERLAFGPQGGDGSVERLAVEVPADRYFDVTREVDLIEEVGRVHGIDENLEATLPSRPAGADEVGAGALLRHQRLLRRAEDVLRDAGLEEAITWTFVAPDASARLGVDDEQPITVHNPLSEDQSVMRTSLLGGLIDAAVLNLSRGAVRVSLFESARVYLPERPPTDGGVLDGHFAGHRPPPAREPHRLAAIVCETLAHPSWRGEAAAADFYLGKGLVELLCGSLRAPLEWRAAERPFLHPGRAAELLVGGRLAGWLGELHPRLREAADLPPAVAFELDAGPLVAASAEGAEIYEDLTSYPAVWEDIAVVVDSSVSAAEVREAIREGGGELLRSARIFDVYEGEQVSAGQRSLALRLEFRATDRTLTDEEVADRRGRIVSALDRVGGSLRG
ncbi:MAG TPA: phenylalanine--tRNA ligase subunit beta [Solirubrobacterales bacterium]|nr:phenylalanine--tRNA ligase subunit beta [Solirubrobacterales bacterium]